MTEPMTNEELEAKALADYEAGVARMAEEPEATEVRLEIAGQVYIYQSAGGSERDAYLRRVANQLDARRQKIEAKLDALRMAAGK